ncbi:hypothetical protein ACFWOJ_37245 [Streptomyces sp. NPDC058439]|uniref:hypothetical protein n=1 Tax=Streptomyces sp. NPDC058439 TaxID=3346500 RepID=UPI003657D976
MVLLFPEPVLPPLLFPAPPVVLLFPEPVVPPPAAASVPLSPVSPPVVPLAVLEELSGF